MILKLIISAFIPVLTTIILLWLSKKSKFKKLGYMTRQIIIGVAFGIITCAATELGTESSGVIVNIRDAAPLTAGLIFSGPSGIIAGIIGGIYRFTSTMWLGGEYSGAVGSLAVIASGFIGAACRRLILDNKHSAWLYGLVIGMSTEVVHMLMLFIAKMDEIDTAFPIVKGCAVQMIVLCGISVMLSSLIFSLVELKGKMFHKKSEKHIVQIFSRSLFVCLLIAFSMTGMFTFVLQTKMAFSDMENLLLLNLEDMKSEIMDASDEYLLDLTRAVKRETQANGLDKKMTNSYFYLEKETQRAYLEKLANRYNVTDICLINNRGIIMLSRYRGFDSFDLKTKPDGQAKDFLCLLNGTKEYVQDYRETDSIPGLYRKFAGVAYEYGGFVQVGYDADNFQDAIAKKIRLAAQNRHIGKEGNIIICKEGTLEVVSSSNIKEGEKLLFNNRIDLSTKQPGKCYRATNSVGTDYFYMFTSTEGYYIIATIPVAEALFSRDVYVYISVFMQIIIFIILFVLIYMLIKKLIVNNIYKINTSLHKITGGNLDTRIDVSGSAEFSSLSKDMNITVSKLKGYIEEAESRIDRELEFAKAIQVSSLPDVFPPYPNRTEFDIYATMHTAKEVGGDFYDFYFIRDNKLTFMIADVAGKGIPAAMFMMTVKTLIKSLAEAGHPVNEIFNIANKKLCESNDTGMLVTAWLGILDVNTGVVEFVNAGHNPPMLMRADGKFEFLRSKPEFALAGLENMRYQKNEFRLKKEDKLFLYTDGVTESENSAGEFYGEKRMKNMLNTLTHEDVTEICHKLKSDIDRFAGDNIRSDDITMLALRYKGSKKQVNIK